MGRALVGHASRAARRGLVDQQGQPHQSHVEGAFQHILTNLNGFIATAIAGLVVLTTGFARADAIAPSWLWC